MIKFSEKYRCFIVLFGAYLIQLSLGSLFTFGHVQPSIIEYMNNNSLSNNSVNSGNTVLIIGALTFGVGASFSLGGFVEEKIGPGKTILIGGWLMSFNIGLMAITMKSYLAIVVISYGFIAGLGLGFAYGVSLGRPIKWFPQHRGLIIGIVVSGFAISSTIFNSLQDAILDKDNKKNIGNLPISFIILAAIYAVLQLIGSILVRKNSDDELNKSIINSISIKSSKYNPGFFDFSSIENQDIKPHQIILERDFWVLWIIFFFNSFLVYFMSASYALYAQQFPDFISLCTLKIYFIVTSLCNCLGRIFFGYLFDKKSFKKVMYIITLSCTLFIGTLPLVYYSNKGFPYIYGISIGLIFFISGGNYTIFPAVCAQLFGMKNFVFNYGILYTSCSVSGIVVSAISAVLFAKPTSGNYDIAFIIGGCFSLIAAGFTAFFRGKSLIIHR